MIVLKGGADSSAFSQHLPQTVEIPVNLSAGRIHLFGGVAGWGFPATGEKMSVLTVKVCYASGAIEDIVLTHGPGPAAGRPRPVMGFQGIRSPSLDAARSSNEV